MIFLLLLLSSLQLLLVLLLMSHHRLCLLLLQQLLLLGLSRRPLLVASLRGHGKSFLLLLMPGLLRTVFLNLLLRWRRWLPREILLLGKLHLNWCSLRHASHHRVHTHTSLACMHLLHLQLLSKLSLVEIRESLHSIILDQPCSL